MKNNNLIKTHTIQGLFLPLAIPLFLLLLGISAKAQQSPDHPDNTYLVSEQIDTWTVNAASQADYNTPAKRAAHCFQEAQIQVNAFRGGHHAIARYFPHQHSTEVTSEIVEDGNLDTDMSTYENKVADGTMTSLAGASHILRVYGSNIRGTSWPVDLNDRRFMALNMQTAFLYTKAHEFAHTFNDALRGSHNNAMHHVDYMFQPIGGGTPTNSDLPSIGVPGGGTHMEVYTSSAIDNIANPAFWGDGTISYDAFDANGNHVGTIYINVTDLDIDQSPEDPNAGVNDNVSDRIAEAVATGDPGYAPAQVPVNPEQKAPQPEIVIEDGKYKLTNGAIDDTLGFKFDDTHRFDATIRYFPYDATNAVNDADLDLPPDYGPHGFTREEMEAGIDKTFYDTNYAGTDIVFERYNWDSDCLGAPSEIIYQDTEAPFANCQNSTIQLGENGTATIDPMQIDNGSTDNVGIVNYVVSPGSVDCNDVGDISITLTVYDEAGNFASCSSTLTVEDAIAPNFTPLDVAADIDENGTYIANAEDFAASPTDNCEIASIELSQTNFSCENIGENELEVSVTDNNGNTTSQEVTLTLSDNLDPIALVQDIQIDLNGSTSISITADDINDGSTDNCGIATMSLSQDTFTEVGNYSIDFTLTDYSSNTVTTTANVEVIDSSVGIAETNNKTVEIYPIPTRQQLTITSYENIRDIMLSDLLGNSLLSLKTNQKEVKLNLNKLSKGIYLIRIKTDNSLFVRRMVKE